MTTVHAENAFASKNIALDANDDAAMQDAESFHSPPNEGVRLDFSLEEDMTLQYESESSGKTSLSSDHYQICQGTEYPRKNTVRRRRRITVDYYLEDSNIRKM